MQGYCFLFFFLCVILKNNKNNKIERILNEDLGFYKAMYRNSIGGMRLLPKLFINATDILAFAQEFGTMPGIMVVKGLVGENAVFNNATNENYNKNKQFYEKLRLRCRQVFYPENSVI